MAPGPQSEYQEQTMQYPNTGYEQQTAQFPNANYGPQPDGIVNAAISEAQSNSAGYLWMFEWMEILVLVWK